MKGFGTRVALSWACVLASGLVSSCGGGGGGGGSAVRVEFVDGSTNCSEGSVTVSVTVRLTLSGEPLAQDVTVEVVDAGTGAATSGVDYTAFPPTMITFPAGSVNGALSTVQISVGADTLLEGPETLMLGLANPTGGAALGSLRVHVILIQESVVARVAFVTASSATPDESSQARDVSLRLELPAGQTLAEDLTMEVSDTTTGTATPGVDYVTFGSRTVTFPAGSSDGTQRSVQVSVQDDVSTEGDETVVLELADTHLFAEVATPSTHTLTITEDDFAAGAHFVATSGGGGGALASGSALPLGSAQNGVGSTAGTALVLGNQGGTAMDLAAPVISGGNVDDFVVEVTAAGVEAPGAALAPAAVASPLIVIGNDELLGLELSLDAARFGELRAAGTRVLVEDFPLPGQGAVRLDLERLPSPWAPGARIAIDGVDSGLTPRQITGPLAIYTGRVRELEGSRVFLALSEDGARGWVRASDELGGLVQLTSSPGEPIRATTEPQLLALGASLPSAASFCDGEVFASDHEGDGPSSLTAQAQVEVPGAVTVANCRLALETDWQFFQKFGSTQGVTTYVTELVAALSERYLADAQTTFSIAYLGIWSSAGDPWTTPDGPGNTTQMLNEFQIAWSPITGSGWPASADLAHFLSGASIGGGRAYINVLCNQSSGFGVSGLHGNSNWGAFPTQSASLNWDFYVVAHELGHNFNARHTHSYCPPIDQCSSDNCNSTQMCTRGTVMSYCHTCPGGLGNIDLEFHPYVANQIRLAVNGSCLGDAMLPAGGQVTYSVRFRPTSGPGAKSATMAITHSAANAPSPFTISLTGTSTP